MSRKWLTLLALVGTMSCTPSRPLGCGWCSMTELLQAHTLLMVPSKDLRGLLDEGPCGFRPPTSFKDGDWHPNDTDPPYNADTYGVEAFALVLAWNGKPVWQGAVWTEGVLTALNCDETPAWRLLVKRVADVLHPGPTRLSMKRLRWLIGDFGTLVLLDAEGREVSDELA